jgi:hypothetical protein
MDRIFGLEDKLDRIRDVDNIPDDNGFGGKEIEMNWRPDVAMIGQTDNIPEYIDVHMNEISLPNAKLNQIRDIDDFSGENALRGNEIVIDWRSTQAMLGITDNTLEYRDVNMDEMSEMNTKNLFVDNKNIPEEDDFIGKESAVDWREDETRVERARIPQYADAYIEETWKRNSKMDQIIDIPDENRFSGEEVEIHWRPDDAMIGRTNNMPEYRYVDTEEISGPEKKIDQIIDVKNIPDKHGPIHRGSEIDWRHNDALIRRPNAIPDYKDKSVEEILMPYPLQKLPDTGSYEMQVQQAMKDRDVNIPGYIGMARFMGAKDSEKDPSNKTLPTTTTTATTTATTTTTTTTTATTTATTTTTDTNTTLPTTHSNANKCFYSINVIYVIIGFIIGF